MDRPDGPRKEQLWVTQILLNQSPFLFIDIWLATPSRIIPSSLMCCTKSIVRGVDHMFYNSFPVAFYITSAIWSDFLVFDLFSRSLLPGLIFWSYLLFTIGDIKKLFGLCPLLSFCLHVKWIVLRYWWGTQILNHSLGSFSFEIYLPWPSFHQRWLICCYYSALLISSSWRRILGAWDISMEFLFLSPAIKCVTSVFDQS